MKKFTIASVFIQDLIDGATRQGLDCEPILLKHGISKLAYDDVKQVPARVPLENFAAVAIEIMRELDDEFLGLTERKQRLGSFNMMCRSCISAKTVKRSLTRTANYWNLFENTYDHSVEIQGSSVLYKLQLNDDKPPLNRYVADSLISSIHRFHCWLAGQFIPLRRVYMDCPEPPHGDEYRSLFYGAPISYDQDFNQIEIDTRYLGLEIVQSPDTLDQYLLGTNLSLLYQPKNYRVISDQVRQWLEKNIRQGNYQATLKQAASHFQMSQQVLHRRLQAENLSFKEIKMQTRRDISINLLFAEKHKIEEIASLVGFSEPSAFIRAFKGWTGVTPLTYRQERR